jgi:hypothetical protein
MDHHKLGRFRFDNLPTNYMNGNINKSKLIHTVKKEMIFIFIEETDNELPSGGPSMRIINADIR